MLSKTSGKEGKLSLSEPDSQDSRVPTNWQVRDARSQSLRPETALGDVLTRLQIFSPERLSRREENIWV